MSCGPGLLFLLVQYGFLWKSEAGFLLLHSYFVPCVIVLVYLRVEWSWYCTSSLCQVYKPALSRVDLVRLTLLTMPDFGDKPQKEGETPLLASHLAKLSNSQTIASLFGQGENNRVHNVSDEVGLICMCTKCAKT